MADGKTIGASNHPTKKQTNKKNKKNKARHLGWHVSFLRMLVAAFGKIWIKKTPKWTQNNFIIMDR